MTAPNRINDALEVCRSRLPLLTWETRSPGKGRERRIVGRLDSAGVSVTVWYDPYAEWFVLVHLTPTRVGRSDSPFASVSGGGPDLALALRTVAQSVAGWTRGVAEAMEVGT